jgi:mannose-6-phosphate isomerase-like protein (cupin superfamily)
MMLKKTNWHTALSAATPDGAAGISHAVLCGDAQFRLHVASIPKKVTPHVHFAGSETYQVVQGEGDLFLGTAAQNGGTPTVIWDAPVHVVEGDCFVIQPGTAHQLRRTGNEPLTIIFGCPDTHLDDNADRTIVNEP